MMNTRTSQFPANYVLLTAILGLGLCHCSKSTGAGSGNSGAGSSTGNPPQRTLIADTTPDYRASVPKGTTPGDVIRYGGADASKGTWTSGTASGGTYDYKQFSEFDTRSYFVAGFESYGFTHKGPDAYIPWIGQDCGNPGVDLPAVRRWTALFSGEIDIEGKVGMDTEHQDLGGIGTRVTLYIDGVSKYEKILIGTDGTQAPFSVEDIPVAEGTNVDFVISAVDETSKIANFTAQIYELKAN